MKHYQYILLFFVLFGTTTVFAQKKLREDIRSGNRFYKQENYKKAESAYRKAFEIDSTNTQVLYNLGTTLLTERELSQAYEMLVRAAQTDKAKNKMKGTKVFHNLGVALQSQQQYDKAIEAYKQALRYNPLDEETRYNLALCQKLLKNNKNNDKNNQKDKNKDKKEDKNKDKDKKEEKKKDQNKDKKDQDKKQDNPPQQNKDEMSKDNAKQLLEAVKQDEKNVKDRLNKQLQKGRPRSNRKSKDW